jgi:hypothetical protein
MSGKDAMTSTDSSGNDMGTEEPFPWEKRLESAMAAYSLKRTKRNKERAEMAERRAYGLMQRHAAKLAANRTDS